MNTFIVEFWSRIFAFLSWFTPSHIGHRLLPQLKAPGAIELWVLTNLVGAILLLAIPDGAGWEVLIVAYGSLRIYEIVIYQINVVLFDAYRKRKAGQQYQLRGFRRLVILLLHNYVELVFWFAVLYRHMSDSFSPAANSFGSALAVSFTTMSGLGSAASSPTGGAVIGVLHAQTLVGLLMTLVVLARFISIIPQPETADEIEQSE